MKKIISILSLSALLVLSNACGDFIEVQPRGTQNLDTYFQNPAECQTFLYGQYARAMWLNDWWQLIAPMMSNVMATDDAWMGNTSQPANDHHNAANYTIDASLQRSRLDGLYRIRYENISNCNVAIARIAESTIDDKLKADFIAQFKFLRAFNYYELVCNFGGMVLVTEPISTSEMNKTRSTAAETWALIIKDLKEAEADSPVLTPQEAKGRVSKGACQALLARAYLFSGDYDNAYDYADKVIKSGTYSLEPNFLDVWSYLNHNGRESIWEIQTSQDATKNAGNYLGTYTGSRGEDAAHFPTGDIPGTVRDGWGWGVPTSDLENAYLSENDEIRRKSTIARFEEPVYGDETDNPTYYFQYNKSNRIIRKYYRPVALRRSFTSSPDRRMPLNFPVLRLAEMYLTRAEAAYFRGDENQARSDMNFVRDRVDLPAKTVTGDELILAIWKERRLELAFENLRLYDLRREIDPGTNKPMIATVMGPNGTFVKYNTGPDADKWETGNTGELQNKGIEFDINKHLLWPIPQGEIDKSNKVIEQNPGY